jgi:hypothetical protein
MVNEHMKRHLTLLIMRVTYFNTTKKPCLTPTRVVLTVKTRKYKWWQGHGGSGPCTLLVGM